MRHKAFRLLTLFTGANVVGILVFYTWVYSGQVRHSKKQIPGSVAMGASPRSYDSSVRSHDRRSSAYKGVQQLDLEGLDRVVGESGLQSGGHTVKPFGRRREFLQDLPPVPEVSTSDDVIEPNKAVMQRFQEYSRKPAKDTVLILTPIHNVGGKLKNFLHLLQSLTYPNDLVSVAFGEDSSHDNTLHAADQIAVELRKSFKKVDVFHFNMSGQVNGSWSAVHSKGNQFHRRSHLAKARNSLLRAGLKDQDWVLWIDSDVSWFPPDLVQQLLSAEKEIVVPLCVYMDGGRKRVFDKNTWRETSASLEHLKGLPPDALMVEGYDTTKRLWLSDLRGEGRVVPIDGVGGCTLLVQSKCHRRGLIFPEDVYQNHIETEGLAKMAKTMGFGVYGMPFLEVFH